MGYTIESTAYLPGRVWQTHPLEPHVHEKRY